MWQRRQREVGVVPVDESEHERAYQEHVWASMREYTQHARGVLADLRAAGYEVEAVQDLRDDAGGGAGVARPVPRDAVTDEPSNRHLRFAIGDSLRGVVDESVLEEVVAIARDTRHGGERDLVVESLARCVTPASGWCRCCNGRRNPGRGSPHR